MSTKRDKKEEEKKRRQNAEKPIGQNKKLAENEQLSRTNASSRTSTPNYTRYYNPEPNDQLSRETGLSVKAQKSTPTPALNLFDNSVSLFSDFTDRFNEDSILSVKNKETPVIEENEQLSRTEEKKEKNATSSKNSQTGENGKSSLFDFSSNGFGSSSRIGNDLVVNNKDTIIANPNYEHENEPRQLSRLSTNGSGSGQADRTMRDELNAAITVGNRSLSKYEELDAETQYKYGNKDYKKYLPGYKSALEKLDDCKLDYLVNKEFIEELYRQFVPSASDRTNETAADQRSLEAQLKQMQSKLDAYLRRTDNMPDLRIYASYLEDIAIAKARLAAVPSGSVERTLDTQSGTDYYDTDVDKALYDALSKTGKFDESEIKTILFIKDHPIKASIIGRPNEYDIPTISERVSNYASNVGLTDIKNVYSGTEINAMRHVMWMASIAVKFGQDIAEEVGCAHEVNADALQDVSDPYRYRYESREDADPAIDLLNNEIGLRIAEEIEPDASMKEICRIALGEYYNQGFNIAEQNPDGSYSIVVYRLTEEEYRSALHTLDTLNWLGRPIKHLGGR